MIARSDPDTLPTVENGSVEPVLREKEQGKHSRGPHPRGQVLTTFEQSTQLKHVRSPSIAAPS